MVKPRFLNLSKPTLPVRWWTAIGRERNRMSINRRTPLKGFLGGSLITVALPPLDMFFDLTGRPMQRMEHFRGALDCFEMNDPRILNPAKQVQLESLLFSNLERCKRTSHCSRTEVKLPTRSTRNWTCRRPSSPKLSAGDEQYLAPPLILGSHKNSAVKPFSPSSG